MDNSLYEHLVARQNQMKTRLIKALSITLALMLAIIAVIFFPTFSLIIIVIEAVVGYFIFPRFNIEYEYTLLYSDLDIDIIYNKAKRKSANSFDLREAELIAPVTSDRLKLFKPTNTLDYSTQNPNDTPYAIIIPFNKNLTKVLIQPDAKMIEHLRNAAPRVTFTD